MFNNRYEIDEIVSTFQLSYDSVRSVKTMIGQSMTVRSSLLSSSQFFFFLKYNVAYIIQFRLKEKNVSNIETAMEELFQFNNFGKKQRHQTE